MARERDVKPRACGAGRADSTSAALSVLSISFS